MPLSFEPRKMTVSTGQEKEEFTDLLVGEVWICSGQSNMQMDVKRVPEIKALVPSVRNLRKFTVKRTVSFAEEDQCEGTWEVAHPESAVAMAFAYHLEKRIEAPVGIIQAAWGSSSLEAWMPRDMTETVPHFKTMMEEFDADTETKEKIAAILEGSKPWKTPDDIFLRRQSNILYNAMIHPLAPYACRGLVWYQGERNTMSLQGMPKEPWFARNSGMLKYGDALKQWMLRYRKEWGNDDFHFLVVMLPGYGKTTEGSPSKEMEHPAAHSWAWMRESQLKALELPHTGVVNTIDLGDAKDIHPKDKLPIGQRLARIAARDGHGKKLIAQGPQMKKVEVGEGAITIHFDHAKGLKTTDGKAPTAFWVTDDSAKWVKASAEIKEESIILSSPELKNPKYIRYAFAGKPAVNLVNKANLPTYPFRTDSFQP